MEREQLRGIFDGRIETLAREIIDQFLVEIPAFARVPREMLDGPILRISEASVRLVPVLLAEGRTPTAEEMAPFAASAAQRAQDGVPLDLIVRGYQIGVRRCWEEALSSVAIAGPAEMRVMTDVFFGLLREVNSVVATAYSEERTALLGQQQEDRARLLHRVLAGDAPEGFDDTTGVRVPAAYLALRVALDRGPDEATGLPGAPIATRAKLRRLLEVVHRAAGEPVLGELDKSGGLLLLPADGPGGPLVPQRLIDDVTAAIGVAVWAASGDAPSAEAGAAAALAGEVLDVVERFGLSPGHYVLDDVLLEYQWTRPTPATARMAALLDPLAGKPALLATVEAHLHSGLNRRRTAEALHVHANTVDYRLRQIEKVLGLDFGRPVDVQRLAAALAARHAPTTEHFARSRAGAADGCGD